MLKTYPVQSLRRVPILLFSSRHLPQKSPIQLGKFLPWGLMNVSGSNPISSGICPVRIAVCCCCAIATDIEGEDCLLPDGLIARPIWDARHCVEAENGRRAAGVMRRSTSRWKGDCAR